MTHKPLIKQLLANDKASRWLFIVMLVVVGAVPVAIGLMIWPIWSRVGMFMMLYRLTYTVNEPFTRCPFSAIVTLPESAWKTCNRSPSRMT